MDKSIVDSSESTPRKKKELPEIPFIPTPLRRLSDNHNRINKAARIIGAGLGMMKMLASADKGGEIIAAFLRIESVHWSGNPPFSDLPAEVKDAGRMAARTMLIQVVAGFEEFVNALKGICEHILNLPMGAVGRPDENWGANEWGSVIGDYLQAAEGVIKGRPAPDPQVKAFLTLAQMFVLLRNRTAHTSRDSTVLSLQRCLASPTLQEALDIVEGETASGRLPLLIIATPEEFPDLQLPHVILASQVFNRLGYYLCHLLFTVDSEKRVLGVAVAEIMRHVDLPKTLMSRLGRLKSSLSRGQFRAWTMETLRISLEKHGYLSTLRKK